MKILVTGGAGFIGSNVVDAYIEEGHQVVVVDDLSSGKRENVNPEASFLQVDIRSGELSRIVKSERPDVINHHAAQISVPASVEDPALDANINILGFINVLEAARATGIGKVIFISSGGAIYGEAEEYPTTEEYRPVPLSPYAISKAVSENYLTFYHNHYGLDYTVLRYANVYGPRQIPHGEAGVVAIFMDRLLSGQGCMLYHFPDEPRGMTRDYTFVGDVVSANVAALERGSGEAFNIGTGIATHTLDLFNEIYRAVKANAPETEDSLSRPACSQARGGDIRRSCLDSTKARGGLGWEPSVDLARGVELTLGWRIARQI